MTVKKLPYISRKTKGYWGIFPLVQGMHLSFRCFIKVRKMCLDGLQESETCLSQAPLTPGWPIPAKDNWRCFWWHLKSWLFSGRERLWSQTAFVRILVQHILSMSPWESCLSCYASTSLPVKCAWWYYSTGLCRTVVCILCKSTSSCVSISSQLSLFLLCLELQALLPLPSGLHEYSAMILLQCTNKLLIYSASVYMGVVFIIRQKDWFT